MGVGCWDEDEDEDEDLLSLSAGCKGIIDWCVLISLLSYQILNIKY